MTKRREDMTAEDIAAARATPGRWVARNRLEELAERVRLTAQGIEFAMGEDETAAEWVAQLRAVAEELLKPRSAEPATPWMEAIADKAIDRVCALLGTSVSRRTRAELVKQALATPPPAEPGGPNDVR